MKKRGGKRKEEERKPGGREGRYSNRQYHNCEVIRTVSSSTSPQVIPEGERIGRGERSAEICIITN